MNDAQRTPLFRLLALLLLLLPGLLGLQAFESEEGEELRIEQLELEADDGVDGDPDHDGDGGDLPALARGSGLWTWVDPVQGVAVQARPLAPQLRPWRFENQRIGARGPPLS